jgi:outer membrane biosynthesis protein TonB
MKLLTGKRIGQSGGELKRAILFSSISHVIFFFAVLFLVAPGAPRFVVPPSYRVKLVDLPSSAANLPPTMSEQAAHAPAPAVKPQAIPHKAAPATAVARPAPSQPAAVRKDAMPELDTKPAKKAVEEAEPAESSAAAGKKQESVTIQAPSEFSTGSVFAWYAYNVSRKITSNWKHPIVPKGTKTKVVFAILRSGMVEYVKLQEPSGIFGFDQASIRAIQISSPFPALPEDFTKSSVVFSVDLLPEE